MIVVISNKQKNFQQIKDLMLYALRSTLYALRSFRDIACTSFRFHTDKDHFDPPLVRHALLFPPPSQVFDRQQLPQLFGLLLLFDWSALC
jgi:hypothetical protein